VVGGGDERESVAGGREWRCLRKRMKEVEEGARRRMDGEEEVRRTKARAVPRG
jgi:hypothetical protein